MSNQCTPRTASWSSAEGMNPKERVFQDFPGDAVVETCLSMQGGARLIPGQGTKILHASWPKNQNIKQTQCVTNSIKTFKK